MWYYVIVKEKGKTMEVQNGNWTGTVNDLREWLNQFNGNDKIVFIGGADDGWEFLDVIVNEEVVVSA